MKELLINIITKFINYIKKIMKNTKNNMKFEESKNEIIKIMYNPIIEKNEKEIDKLLAELKGIKEQVYIVNKKNNMIKQENMAYNKKIKALNCFQQFLLDNHS